MCDICGCDATATATAVNLQTGKAIGLAHEHVHADGTRHSHPHEQQDHHHHDDDHHHHHHDAGQGRVVTLEAKLLAKNDGLAERNRSWLAERGVLSLNLMGAPGAGKTALLERTIRDLRGLIPLFVVEGDQATSNDGERIRAAGAPVVQVNTGTGCHLDADMVARGLDDLKPAAGSLVVIENVGNLVCPALFDLGERRRIAVLSVTEGDDKPLKYPHMFQSADVVLLNKIDLLPYVDFDVARAIENARVANPDVTVFRVSARSGDGLDAWYGWLRAEMSALHEAANA